MDVRWTCTVMCTSVPVRTSEHVHIASQCSLVWNESYEDCSIDGSPEIAQRLCNKNNTITCFF
ncbi:hypothetical protein TELCIR_13066 [Teladorsagia circumcincta]|uniref:Uncharacterized protein n=1 Tax=Teladorsagia circumcincta TaxID=45464 RepID=A0A2G9U6E6_TELCI|nr:hypothetical protein TELCIR_13066 [Teladorsagia circumcincta]